MVTASLRRSGPVIEADGMINRAMYYVKRFRLRPIAHPSSKVAIHDMAKYIGGIIVVGKNSSLVIEDGAIIDGEVILGECCSALIRRNSFLKNVNIEIKNDSYVEVGEGSILYNPKQYPNRILVDKGVLILSEMVRIEADVSVRLGGRLEIGKYTKINHGSEIRCEESITIGSYGMISYEVCIFDTNTHSTDWKQRRDLIEDWYPFGPWEHERPITQPIRIGNDVWIGKGATITKGCIIGNRCIVGTRTVVGGGKFSDDCVIVTQEPRVVIKQGRAPSELSSFGRGDIGSHMLGGYHGK